MVVVWNSCSRSVFSYSLLMKRIPMIFAIAVILFSFMSIINKHHVPLEPKVQHSKKQQGIRQVGKAADFDSAMRWFESIIPCHHYRNFALESRQYFVYNNYLEIEKPIKGPLIQRLEYTTHNRSTSVRLTHGLPL